MLNFISKLIIITGLVLVLLGVLLRFLPNIKFIGRLPGDIYIKKENFVFYFPIATSILLSIIISFILKFFYSKK